jgi:hypothetical protein
MSDPTTPTFARIAHAWGELIGLSERRSLCALAYLQPALADMRWSRIPPEQQDKLILAFRRAIELGEICATVLIREAAAAQRVAS